MMALYISPPPGLGLSYIFSDQFKIAGDIYRTYWNNFEYLDENGQTSSPVSSMDSSNSDIDTTTWFRFGCEYRMIDPQRPKSNFLALRAGLFYDPAPTEKSSDDFKWIHKKEGEKMQIKKIPYGDAGTQLIRIILVYKGWELDYCEEYSRKI